MLKLLCEVIYQTQNVKTFSQKVILFDLECNPNKNVMKWGIQYVLFDKTLVITTYKHISQLPYKRKPTLTEGVKIGM